MILVDSSVWIEFLRATGSKFDLALNQLIESKQPIATTDVVVMELLAGARDDEHHNKLRRLLYRHEFIRTQAPLDYELAADVYRHCRYEGITVRKLTDCLIAAVAVRSGAVLMHCDSDFELIAKKLSLKLFDLSKGIS